MTTKTRKKQDPRAGWKRRSAELDEATEIATVYGEEKEILNGGRSQMKWSDYWQFVTEATVFGCVFASGSRDVWRELRLLLDAGSFVHPLALKCFECVDSWANEDSDSPIHCAFPVGSGKLMAYASYCADCRSVSPSHLSHYSRLLYEAQRKRELSEINARDRQRQQSGAMTADELQSALDRELQEFRDADKLAEAESDDSLIDTFILEAVGMAQGELERNAVLTGVDWFDDCTGGLMCGDGNSEQVVIAGRPGGGKSSLARNLGAGICDRGGVVVYLIGEMTKKQWWATQVQELTGIDAGLLLMGSPFLLKIPNITPKLVNAANTIKGWNQVVIEKKITVDQIAVEVAKARLKYGRVDLVVMDYIEKYLPGKEEKRVEIARVSAAMQEHSKKTGIPNLILSQMSREYEKNGKQGEEKRNPRMSDLAESSAMEKDATQIYFCDERGLFCAKARFGQKDVWLPTRFNGQRLRWEGKG